MQKTLARRRHAPAGKEGGKHTTRKHAKWLLFTQCYIHDGFCCLHPLGQYNSWITLRPSSFLQASAPP
eukprot:8792297-Pyramimonas_sp.AAC.1